MKLYDKNGTVYLASFDAETLYDVSLALRQVYEDAIVVLRVTTLTGRRVAIHMQDLDLDKTFEEQVTTNFPPITDEEIKDYAIIALHGLQ